MGSKQIHDAYGKKVLRRAFKNDFNDSPHPVSFGDNAGTLKIDGTIGDDIAVEIESRASKQVRGAIIDIVCHPFPKKLIVLIKKHGNDFTENQCRELLKKFAPDLPSAVVTLVGNGNDDHTQQDAEIARKAVVELRNSHADYGA